MRIKRRLDGIFESVDSIVLQLFAHNLLPRGSHRLETSFCVSWICCR